MIDLCRELIKETYGLHENEVGTPVNRRACRVDVKKIDQIDCMLQRLEKELEDG